MSHKIKTLNISNDELSALIDEEINKIEELLPTDWTVSRVADKKGISTDRARRLLNRLVRENKAVVVKARVKNSHVFVNAYRKK